MKVTINYEYNANFNPNCPYWARSGKIQHCGSSFEDAKLKLLNHLKLIKGDVVAPKSEDIEI